MASSTNRYSTPKYYRHFKSTRLTREEMLRLMSEDSQALMNRGVSFTIQMESYCHRGSKDISLATIYPDHYTPYHDHDFFECNYVFDGELLEYIDGRQIILHRGDMLIIAPNVRHVSNPYQRTRAYNVLLSQSFAERCAKRLAQIDAKNYLSSLIQTSGFQIFHATHGMAEPLLTDMHDLLCKMQRNNPYRVPLMECLGTELLIRLATYSYDNYVHEENVLRENLPERILANRILKYIRDNIATVNLENLSKYFGYSKRQIERLVEKYSGKKYTNFVRDFRRSEAEKLLVSTKQPIAQIAAELGFGSAEYFCRWYRHFIGGTPSQTREKYACIDKGEKVDRVIEASAEETEALKAAEDEKDTVDTENTEDAGTLQEKQSKSRH